MQQTSSIHWTSPCLLRKSGKQYQPEMLLVQDVDEAEQSLLSSTGSTVAVDERRLSSEGTSSSTAGCLALLQEGFAEGIVSLKEAAAYISQKDHRCSLQSAMRTCVSHWLVSRLEEAVDLMSFLSCLLFDCK